MKDKKVCPTCGAKMVEYTFSFNKGLARFLGRLYENNGPAKTDALGLTYSQRTNSQKLRYWDLAVPFVNEESTKKRGWWEITPRGKAFVEGKITIQKQVVMCRNKFVRFEGARLFFKDVSDGYEYRSDYQRQAANQIQPDMFQPLKKGEEIMKLLDPLFQIGFDADDASIVNSTHSYKFRKDHPSVRGSHDTRLNRASVRHLGSIGHKAQPGPTFKGGGNKWSWGELGKFDQPSLLASGLALRVEHTFRFRRSQNGMPGIKPLVYLGGESVLRSMVVCPLCDRECRR